nr:hypothetical protein [Tanacetum cinerariifolium]
NAARLPARRAGHRGVLPGRRLWAHPQLCANPPTHGPHERAERQATSDHRRYPERANGPATPGRARGWGESLLVDLARKVDQQGEAIARQGEALVRQGAAIERMERRLDNIDEQIGDIINIFKLSEARHTQNEQRLDSLAVEIKEQGRRTDETIQVQMQMLALMRAGNAKAEELDQRLGLMEGQEPRIKRLEDEVFRAAG